LKTILVCDGKNYISRFLKYNFKSNVNVVKFSKCSFSRSTKFKSFDLIVFVVYDDIDLIHLFDMFNVDVPIIVASENNKLLYLLCSNLDVITVDLNRIKIEILSDFETKISLLLNEY
jgi:hypothetical protein